MKFSFLGLRLRHRPRYSSVLAGWVAVSFLASAVFSQNIQIAEYPVYKSELERYQAAFNGAAADRGQALAEAGIERAVGAGDASGEAHWVRLLGASHQIRGQWGEARAAYERSLQLRRRLGQTSEILTLTSGLGFVCYTTGDYVAARKYLEEARTLSRQSKNPIDLARAWFTLGLVERAERRFDPAKTAFSEAMKIYSAAAGPAGQGGVGLTHLEIARLNIDHSLLPDALREGFEAVQLLSKLPRREADTASALDVVGTVFHRMQEPAKALDYFRRALELRTKVKADLTESHQFMAVELDQLGRHAEALTYLELVLANQRKAGRSLQIATALINLAVAQQNVGRMSVARANFTEALSLLPTDRARARIRATAMYGLGNLDISEAKFDDAVTHHEEALKLRREIGDSLGTVRCLNRIGIALEGAGRWSDALDRHKEAATAFEALLAGVRNPVQAVSFRSTSAILYPHYSYALVKLGRAREGLAIAERGKGTGLDRIASLGAPSPQVLEAAHGAAAARNRFRIAFENGADDQSEQVAYVNAVHELSRVLDMPQAGVVTTRNRTAPRLYDDFMTLASRHPDTLFLEWVCVNENVTLLFSVSARHGLKTVALPISSERIEELVDAWYGSMREVGRSRGVKLPSASADGSTREPEEARRLWQAIFGEASSQLEGFSRLVLIPDGPLLRVPFAALMDADGRRLTDRFSSSTAVSLASLMNNSGAVKSGAGRVYAVGDPSEGGQMVGVVPQRMKLGALAGARSEVQAIAELLPGSSTVLGHSAREADVKRQMGSFEVLHFATHGVLDVTDPLRSALLLAPEPASSQEDGMLEGWEIASMKLNARLAVLSACDTGQGRETSSDGVLGLSWAFQAAGCPNVLATLWSVDDAATQSIMVEFYKALRRGERIDDSLRHAISAVRSDPAYPPYYWAAFQVVGPAGPVFDTKLRASQRSTKLEEKK